MLDWSLLRFPTYGSGKVGLYHNFHCTNSVVQYDLGEDDVGLAAEGADRAVMHGRPAVRTPLLKDFPAERAELPARRIRRGPIRPQKRPPVHLVGRIRRTFRIRTEPARSRRRQTSARELAHRCFLLQRNPELLRQLPDDRIVQLRPIPLLEHRKRRLFAPNLRSNDTLRQLRRTASHLELFADFWTQICHGHIL